jgi:hypothetical protein
LAVEEDKAMTMHPFALGASLAAGIAFALAAGWSSAAPQGKSGARTSGRQCFLPRQVSGFEPVDEDTVNVTVGARTVYQLELFGICRDVNWSHRIGIRSTHGGSWVCQGMDAELLVPGPTGVDRCQVSSVRRLSDAEVEALRKGGKHRR